MKLTLMFCEKICMFEDRLIINLRKRTILKDVLYNELEKVKELLDSLEHKERLEPVIKIYIYTTKKWTKLDTLIIKLFK